MSPIHWDTIATGLVSALILWLVGRLYGAIKEIIKKLDAIGDATQTNMRAQLVHMYEKYMTRGWLTPEERAAWYDMHEKYSALNANGLIDSYRVKLEHIPDKEI